MEEEDRTENSSNMYGFLFEALPSHSSFLVNYEWINSNAGGSIVDETGTVTVNNPRGTRDSLNPSNPLFFKPF